MAGCRNRRLCQELESCLAEEERALSEGHSAAKVKERAENFDRLPGRSRHRPLAGTADAGEDRPPPSRPRPDSLNVMPAGNLDALASQAPGLLCGEEDNDVDDVFGDADRSGGDGGQ